MNWKIKAYWILVKIQSCTDIKQLSILNMLSVIVCVLYIVFIVYSLYIYIHYILSVRMWHNLHKPWCLHTQRQFCSPVCREGESRSRRSSGLGRGQSSRPPACCHGNPAGSYYYYCCSRDRRCDDHLTETSRGRQTCMWCVVSWMEIGVRSLL